MASSEPNQPHRGIDALLPREMAEKAEAVGVQKTGWEAISLLTLAILGGAFIALGAMFATTVLAGAEGVVPFGLGRYAAIQGAMRRSAAGLSRRCQRARSQAMVEGFSPAIGMNVAASTGSPVARFTVRRATR